MADDVPGADVTAEDLAALAAAQARVREVLERMEGRMQRIGQHLDALEAQQAHEVLQVTRERLMVPVPALR